MQKRCLPCCFSCFEATVLPCRGFAPALWPYCCLLWLSVISVIELLVLLQFQILRKKGTEAPGTGLYNKSKEEGEYNCAGCGTLLYKYASCFLHDVLFLWVLVCTT